MYTCTVAIIQQWEGTPFYHCDNRDGPREYYAEWNKRMTDREIRETQILYDFSYMGSKIYKWINKTK